MDSTVMEVMLHPHMEGMEGITMEDHTTRAGEGGTMVEDGEEEVEVEDKVSDPEVGGDQCLKHTSDRLWFKIWPYAIKL